MERHAGPLPGRDRARGSGARHAIQPPVPLGHAALAQPPARRVGATAVALRRGPVRRRRCPRARHGLLQGRRGRLRGRTAAAAAARAAVGREVDAGHPAQARARGVQPAPTRARSTPCAAARCTNPRCTSCRRRCGRSSATPTASDIQGELCPSCRMRLEGEYGGDFMRMPIERIFISEAGRVGIGTYAPHDPTTADLADLVGSVDLSKVAEFGDEGRPARLVLVGRRLQRQPRRAGDDRDPEGQARVPLPAADADPGEERQGLALPADLRRRDHRGAHQPRRVPQVPAGEARTRRCSIAW